MNTKTPLETAQEHYNAWLTAELELAYAQSYTIGSRSLTRANLAEVREQITFWHYEIARLEKGSGGRNRTMRFVLRDL